jgi:hypothetical protein
MRKNRRFAIQQAAVCLSCIAIVWRYTAVVEGTEFSGGRVTGVLLHMQDAGSMLFVIALLLAFLYRRIAAAVTLVAFLLCLPLFLYFTAPGPFRAVFGGEWSVPLRTGFIWDDRTIVGIVVLVIAAWVSLRGLRIAGDAQSRNSA